MKEFICPKCKTAVPHSLEPLRLISCNCLTVSSIDEHGRIEKSQKLPHSIMGFSPNWLKPGGQFEYGGKDFTVRSIFSYSVSWEEWDSEDKRWLKGNEMTREYYAFAPDGSELCLENDDGSFFFRSEVTGRLDSYTLDQFYKTEKDGLIEKGTFNLSAFLGEDDEPLDLKTYHYKVVSDINGDLTGEGTAEDFKNKTVRFYRQEYITKPELDGLHAKFNPKFDLLNQKRLNAGFLRWVFLLPSLVFFLAWGRSYFGKQPILARGHAGFEVQRQADSLSGTPKTLCRVALDKDQNYALSTYCTFQSYKGEIDLSLSIIKIPEGTLVNAIECDFYTDSGVDSEGSWTESTLKDELQFKIEESGEYEFIMTPLSGIDNSSSSGESIDWSAASKGIFSIEISPTSVSRWYGLAFFLTFFFWIIYQWRWEDLGTRLGIRESGALLQVWDYLKRQSS